MTRYLTRRAFKYLSFAALVAGGVSACNGLGGVHLNSQVLQGLGTGLQLEPMTPVSPEAPPAVESEPLDATAAKPWSSPPSTLGATAASGASGASAPLGSTGAAGSAGASQANVARTSEIATPRAGAEAASASPAAPQTSGAGASAPVVASAPSFVGQKTTVVGLGDPGRDGLWMETPLVSARRNARLLAPNGKSVVVTLEPIAGDAGQGSRLSIGGMRALGLPLTELVEIRVGPV
ncbi:hypothetical protein [Phaeobacter sp. B1627]|uniref:hypothetical protein n=1 Tax=Phaeobacter sp. B1627 TaxID=2583809 RepID=UPI001118A223|nr:hypothetical protein [Phaeobacter sp. B1627]TNJ42700.1 hypothetical protein FGE21_10370 [Phaeobacter sp. B1627]